MTGGGGNTRILCWAWLIDQQVAGVTRQYAWGEGIFPFQINMAACAGPARWASLA